MAPETTAEANRYRIDRLERDMRDLQQKLDDYGALKQNVTNLAHEVAGLSTAFDDLRKALYTSALTVAGSVVLLTVGILIAVAR